MLLWSSFVILVALLRNAASLEAVGSSIGVPEPVQVWTLLQHLLRGDNRKLLPDLFPFVTQLEELEELEEDQESPNCGLVTKISGMLSTQYGLDDIASLLPIYAALYPMGHWQHASETSNENYFMLNGKRYDKSEDVFYLKSKELQEQARIADDRVVYGDEVIIGINSKAPVIILYGCPDSEGEFEEFNRNLYSEASSTGKLRYLWRSTCSFEKSSVKDIPIALTKTEESKPSVLSKELLRIPADFTEGSLGFYDLSGKSLADVDLKVAALIAGHYREHRDFHRTLEYARGIINNYPLLTKQLAALQISTAKVLESNKKLKKNGLDYHMLGLFINGQGWRLSEVDRYSLINAITHEYFAMQHLESILRRYDDVATSFATKRLLQVFSEISLPSLEQSQPIKVDLHRIPGFSEAIIYFNDVEIDGQYEDMATDIRNFYEESKFGELPDVRKNWNEVIFAVDFGNLEDENTRVALDGLNRAIKVIAQGYPQRVGLLPLNSGTGEGLIHKMYQLKHQDLFELSNFLENIPQNFIGSHYEGTPDYSSVIQKLQVHETSIIINGDIYPFRKNTWHYLIAKTIKRDKAYLKGELAKLLNYEQTSTKDIDVRGLLHARSADTRHEKYTPDYFADASYTSLDNTALKAIEDSIVETIKGEKYVTLHTVTLVDDFSTSVAIRRLKNLLNTNFFGVRIRIINSGLSNGGRWKAIKKAVRRSDLAKLDSLILANRNNQPQFVANQEALSRWLVDLPTESIGKGAFVVVNGRFIHLEREEAPETYHFEAIIKREAQRTLNAVQALEQVLPETTSGSIDPNLMETVSSALSKLYYHGTEIYNNGIDYTAEGAMSRLSLQLEINHYTVFQSHDSPKLVDVTLFMDPTEERSQKLISLISSLEGIPFVNLQIVLLPTEDVKITPIHRVYLDGTEDLEVTEKLQQNFQVELDPPSNFLITNTSELDGIIVEAHVFRAGETISRASIDGVAGVCLELVDGDQQVEASCLTMGTFGYGQFVVRSLRPDYTIRSCDPRFRVTSFALNGRPDYVDSDNVALLNLDKVKLRVEVAETGVPANPPEQEPLNIYTVLKDNGEDEATVQKMIEALAAQTSGGKQVKLWILDQPFLSASFKKFCYESPLAVQFIQYAWPPWLRPVSLSDRRMDLYKILFVDVMFPQATSRIVYMDPTATPIDVSALDREPTGSAPFAMFEATGTGYWQDSYWSSKLAGTKKRFHTATPAFVVDLVQLRNTNGGDKLRIHYQRLSVDIHSLGHTHEELINDLQLELAIDTLTPPQRAVRHDEL